MAVLSVYEIWEGREGSQVLDGRKREYTRVFEVTTSESGDGPVVALGAGAIAYGLPIFGTSHPEDLGAIVQEITPTQNSESPWRWTVSVKYSSEIPAPELAQPGEASASGSPADLPENPLARPPVWKFSFQTAQRVAEKGFLFTAGSFQNVETPITNSASEKFDPPAMMDQSQPMVAITINRPTWSLAKAVTLQDAVNSVTWQGVSPRCARCLGIDAQSMYENGVAYWQVTYNIGLKWDTWDLQILDAGWSERVYADEAGGGAMKIKQIVDPNGNSGVPYLLNGEGLRLPVGDPEVYRRYAVYRALNFASFIF